MAVHKPGTTAVKAVQMKLFEAKKAKAAKAFARRLL
jgi:hypothetical protein